MAVAALSARVANAYSLWPKQLLETELNCKALASTVQHDLFGGSPSGWKAHVEYMQTKAAWFGSGIPEMETRTSEGPAPSTSEDASPVESSVEDASPVEWGAPDETRGSPLGSGTLAPDRRQLRTITAPYI